MRLAVSGKIDDEFLAYARQVGATDYIGGGNDLPTDKGYFGFQELMLLRQRIENAGLRWAVLDNKNNLRRENAATHPSMIAKGAVTSTEEDYIERLRSENTRLLA